MRAVVEDQHRQLAERVVCVHRIARIPRGRRDHLVFDLFLRERDADLAGVGLVVEAISFSTEKRGGRRACSGRACIASRARLDRHRKRPMDAAEKARLTALSPLDGRYARKVDALREQFSEFALIRQRVRVEIAWLLALAAEPGDRRSSAVFGRGARDARTPSPRRSRRDDAARVKAIERTTNHDVKAVEYWLKERFAGVPELARVAEFIHFACTSEDINNLAYGIALHEARASVLLPLLGSIAADLRVARARACRPADARAHARPAGDADDARQGDRERRTRGWSARSRHSRACRSRAR